MQIPNLGGVSAAEVEILLTSIWLLAFYKAAPIYVIANPETSLKLFSSHGVLLQHPLAAD